MANRPMLLLTLVLLLGLGLVTTALSKRKAQQQHNAQSTRIAGAAAPATPGLIARTLTLPGQPERRFFVYNAPLPHDDERHPQGRALMLFLHGGGGSAERFVNQTHTNLLDAARRHDTVLIFPEGVEHHWNDGRVSRQLTKTVELGVDDVKFLNRVIDTALADYRINPDAVMMVGISNGGMMTHRFACESAERLQAMAVISSSMPTPLVTTCQPKRPVSALFINGTADPLVPYTGGNVGKAGVRGQVIGVEQDVQYWAARFPGYQRTTPPKTVNWPDKAPNDGTRVEELTYYKNGPQVVRLLKVINGGHSWPGTTKHLPQILVGTTTQEINAADVLWAFLKETTPAQPTTR